MIKKPQIGSWVTLAHPAIAEIMAKAGFDWLAVDLEHSVITIAEAEQLIRVIDLCGVKPYVRLTANDSHLIKRVMDAGAHGVIVPMVVTLEDAKAAVKAVQYPPLGSRGVGLARAQGYGASFNDYKKWLPKHAKVIVQIEHIDALKHLDDIFSLPGISGYIVGPYDLSGSMGKPGQFEDHEFVQVLNTIHTTAKKHQMMGGIHIIEPDPSELKKSIIDGHQFIAYSLDIRMLDVSARVGLNTIKEYHHENSCNYSS
jgi:2-keto-3-deoxy-L-rhamnonate aldolase RhmA